VTPQAKIARIEADAELFRESHRRAHEQLTHLLQQQEAISLQVAVASAIKADIRREFGRLRKAKYRLNQTRRR
jgi:hypothetical protein